MAERTKDAELPEMLGLRLDPKTRYLAELAARATGCDLSTFVKEAIQEKFARVTLRKPKMPEPLYGGTAANVVIPPIDPQEEFKKNDAMTVANMANKLWSENPFTRLEIRALTFPHLLTTEDEDIINFIHSQDDFKIQEGDKYKLDHETIAFNWANIKAFANRKKEK